MISTTSLVWISSQKITTPVGGYIIGLLDHLPQAGGGSHKRKSPVCGGYGGEKPD